MSENFLWTEAYRPVRLDDVILPERIKSQFLVFLEKGYLPNLLLSGGPGIGKTTLARALLEELGAEYIIINGSMNGNIDTLRNEIQTFASTISMTGGRKYVILDEADYLNPTSTQPALRNFMEQYSKNCGFILTCNFKNRIISPLHSRCSVIDFSIVKEEKAGMMGEIFTRLRKIAKAENVTCTDQILQALVVKHFPDFRRMINQMQQYSGGAGGTIESDILSAIELPAIQQLASVLKEKQFTQMRKWVAENIDQDATAIFRQCYDVLSTKLAKASVPQLILILADYQYKSAFVADQEINLVACFTEVMSACEFE